MVQNIKGGRKAALRMKQVKNYELESRRIEIFISLFLKRGSK